jgi:hypothetical protein
LCKSRAFQVLNRLNFLRHLTALTVCDWSETSIMQLCFGLWIVTKVEFSS